MLIAGGAEFTFERQGAVFPFWSYFNFARNEGPIAALIVVHDGSSGPGKFFAGTRAVQKRSSSSSLCRVSLSNSYKAHENCAS